MATLLRTGGTATKLISGFHAPGVVPPAAAVSAATYSLPDQSGGALCTESLQALANRSNRGGIVAKTFSLKKGINVTSRRLAHTDVTFPNFDEYRHDATKDVTKPARETEDDRKAMYNGAFYGVGGMIALYATKEIAQTLVYYKAMAADQRALASIEIKLSEIPEGQTKTFEWRGKPVFVKHRTPQEIQRENSVNVSELRHPQTDEERVQKPEWSVVIGVCTHLGCIPIAGAGDFGGYFCPCHGSHYDGSGRIRKGPAPLNLHVPSYSFKGDIIVVG
jgi:ubiquinol-cytochrome c reductase iron-sulfur subunit